MRLTWKSGKYILLLKNMGAKYWIVCLFGAVCLFYCANAQGEEDGAQSITPCDRAIIGKMCDELKEKISDCADLMPEDEKPFFFECATELGVVETDTWMPMLDAICAKDGERVETAYEIVKCWDEKMNATVGTTGNDKVYPADHFACKSDIFDEALDKTECQCQMEKRNSCNNNPAAPPGLGN